MKITELLEAPIATSIKDRTVSGGLRPYSNKRAYGNTETGAFSNVKPDVDPHMVKKTSNSSLDPQYKEGFRVFIEFIIENKFTNNPHMPRVYSVHKIVGADGYTIDSFKTEKLLTYKQVKREEINDYVTSVRGEGRIPKWALEDPDEYAMFSYLAGEIEEEVKLGGDRFALESLNEACDIISKALAATKDLGTINDLHYGNILFRRTPFGLQAVLNDPLYIPK